MRTTIDLPDELFRQAKAKAALEGISLKEAITRYIELGLRSSPPSSDRVARKRSPLPVLERTPGRPIPALTNADIQALFDEEDAEIRH